MDTDGIEDVLQTWTEATDPVDKNRFGQWFQSQRLLRQGSLWPFDPDVIYSGGYRWAALVKAHAEEVQLYVGLSARPTGEPNDHLDLATRAKGLITTLRKQLNTWIPWQRLEFSAEIYLQRLPSRICYTQEESFGDVATEPRQITAYLTLLAAFVNYFLTSTNPASPEEVDLLYNLGLALLATVIAASLTLGVLWGFFYRFRYSWTLKLSGQ